MLTRASAEEVVAQAPSSATARGAKGRPGPHRALLGPSGCGPRRPRFSAVYSDVLNHAIGYNFRFEVGRPASGWVPTWDG